MDPKTGYPTDFDAEDRFLEGLNASGPVNSQTVIDSLLQNSLSPPEVHQRQAEASMVNSPLSSLYGATPNFGNSSRSPLQTSRDSPYQGGPRPDPSDDRINELMTAIAGLASGQKNLFRQVEALTIKVDSLARTLTELDTDFRRDRSAEDTAIAELLNRTGLLVNGVRGIERIVSPKGSSTSSSAKGMLDLTQPAISTQTSLGATIQSRSTDQKGKPDPSSSASGKSSSHGSKSKSGNQRAPPKSPEPPQQPQASTSGSSTSVTSTVTQRAPNVVPGPSIPPSGDFTTPLPAAPAGPSAPPAVVTTKDKGKAPIVPIRYIDPSLL